MSGLFGSNRFGLVICVVAVVTGAHETRKRKAVKPKKVAVVICGGTRDQGFVKNQGFGMMRDFP